MIKLTTELFIQKAKEIHNEKYDYSLVIYEGSFKKIRIICPEHGEFLINPSNHIHNNQGCPKCGYKIMASKRKHNKEYLLKLIKTKDNYCNYDFSLIDDFSTMKSQITCVCKTHGQYLTRPSNLIRSKFFGCKKCQTDNDKCTQKEYITKCQSIHNNFYTYDNLIYNNSHDYVTVTCPKHGDFDIKAYIHIAGKGLCPKCTDYVSSYEKEIQFFLEENNIQIESSYRKFKDIKEIDLINHNQKIAIEFNGLYWHSEEFKPKQYHIEKTIKLNNLGYRLIHIFEDEWIEKKDICKSILLNAFNKTKNKIYARKCLIKEVSSKDAQEFLNKNHIQGNAYGSVRYGLYFNEELVSLMTFCKPRSNLGNKSNKKDCFELLRFCNKLNTIVIGGASKLLSFFKNNNKFNTLVSYCDIRWGTGKLYKNLGFSFVSRTQPNYFYFKQLKRYNRFSFRKDVLIKNGYDKNKTEAEIMQELKYKKIYDCGCYKYEINNVLINEDDLV